MPLYLYKAVNRQGVLHSGELSAATREGVIQQLLGAGATPVDISERGAGLPGWLYRPVTFGAAISKRDVARFTQELAALLQAGLTIDRALNLCADLAERTGVQRLLRDLTTRIREGEALADALSAQGTAFPGYYVSMVRAGELGGSLPGVFGRLSTLLERTQQLRDRVHSALVYPAILAGMIVVTLILVMTVVLPRFERLFADMHATLPWPTRIVLALSDVASSFGWLFGLMVIVGALTAIHALKRPDTRLRWDRWLLGRRVVGPLTAEVESARFLRTLGTLIANGVALPSALRVATSVFQNRALAAATEEVTRRLKAGDAFGALLAEANVFPRLAVQLVRVGEESGQLDDMLLKAADILERGAQTKLERLLAILVPSITIGMGLLVAALIGSVLVGILSVNELAF